MSNESENEEQKKTEPKSETGLLESLRNENKHLQETLWKVAKMLDMGLGLDDFAPDQETWDEMFDCLSEPRMWALNALGMGLWEWSHTVDDDPNHWVNKWYNKNYTKTSE